MMVFDVQAAGSFHFRWLKSAKFICGMCHLTPVLNTIVVLCVLMGYACAVIPTAIAVISLWAKS
jgi:hypothetical protein